jgi:hypothetical protein
MTPASDSSRETSIALSVTKLNGRPRGARRHSTDHRNVAETVYFSGRCHAQAPFFA